MSGFYQSYLDLAANLTPLAPELVPLRDRNFSQFYRQQEDSYTAVTVMAEVLHHSLLKPQRLLLDHQDYYVAVDLLTNTYYQCFRDLLMVDVDRYKSDREEDTLTVLKDRLKQLPHLFFRVYASRNGYHLFLVNQTRDYRSEAAIRLMEQLGSDFYYMVYSYLRGWSVRLNKKKGEEASDQLYQWVGDSVAGVFLEAAPGATAPLEFPPLPEELTPNPRLLRLVQMHLDLTELFSKEEISSMPAPL
jgi:hypothetical protein